MGAMTASYPIKRRSNGFTLVEVMVVVAMMAVLTALAAPSLQQAFDRYRVAAAYDELRSTYTFARSEAIRTRQQVVIARTAGGACATVQEWQCGWTVFVDANANNVMDGAETVLRSTGALTGGTTIMTFNAAQSRIVFNRWGNVTPLGAFRQVIAPRGDSNLAGTSTVCSSAGGRLRKVEGDAGNTTCNAQ